MRPGLGDLGDLGGKDKIRQAYLRHLPTSPQRGSGWAVVFWGWKKGVPFDISRAGGVDKAVGCQRRFLGWVMVMGWRVEHGVGWTEKRETNKETDTAETDGSVSDF